MAEQGYKPSERVPVSGIYRVVHNSHRPEHEATLIEDETFPSCAMCGEEVRFIPTHKATSIRQDRDFSRR